jgi:hypothetical protein
MWNQTATREVLAVDHDALLARAASTTIAAAAGAVGTVHARTTPDQSIERPQHGQ